MSRRRIPLLLALAAGTLAASCEQSPTAPWRPGEGDVAEGTWSSVEMGIDVSSTDVDVVFPFCAEGTIVAPIDLREDGTFDASGTYNTIGSGAQAARWARYIGLVKNRRMTLTVLLGDPIAPGGRDVYGPFDLAYGDDLPDRPSCPAP